jgi:hypothetical protein
MLPTLLAAAALCHAAPAWASQMRVNFDDCSAIATEKDRNLDCSSSTAVTRVVASILVEFNLTDIIADEGAVDVAVGNDWRAGLPAFWQFNSGGCGAGNIGFDANFAAGPYTCHDFWGGLAVIGGQYGGIGSPTPQGGIARIKWTAFVTPENVRTLPSGVEAYIARITFRQQHLASCPEGCNTPTCLYYQDEVLLDLKSQSYHVYEPDRLFINDPTHWHYCGFVPTKPTTWGSVKSLYR